MVSPQFPQSAGFQSSNKDGFFRFGLLGQSLGHSLSPVIHQAFFEELGLAGSYEKIEVANADDVPGKLSELAQEGFAGINVTIPYKLTVLPRMASLDQSAELAGAVNTIKFGAAFSGYNTDVGGLAEALSNVFTDASIFAAGSKGGPARAMILGCGGAARAAVVALSLVGFKQLAICVRNQENARAMLDQILLTAERASLVQNCRAATISSFEAGVDGEFASNVSLVVNATPIGQKNDELPLPVVQILERVLAGSRTATFVDLVYSRSATPLCRKARELGFVRVEDGTEMLIHQARLAFNIWTGHLPVGDLARQRLMKGNTRGPGHQP